MASLLRLLPQPIGTDSFICWTGKPGNLLRGRHMQKKPGQRGWMPWAERSLFRERNPLKKATSYTQACKARQIGSAPLTVKRPGYFMYQQERLDLYILKRMLSTNPVNILWVGANRCCQGIMLT